ncbi:hypothetical protein M011DRAFT_474053 [Sporormia fimetaria CBS 119925]|uniref:Uncharacterized protein n=1 Tax=Sporormia fimetaria CBS 119925 TaxID=1340428 RepID=A0A6A6VPC2_9PLEO|nr:hypothetical protein M011DRAFT_474053 [Sporormia fimetaria CBS 119925]
MSDAEDPSTPLQPSNASSSNGGKLAPGKTSKTLPWLGKRPSVSVVKPMMKMSLVDGTSSPAQSTQSFVTPPPTQRTSPVESEPQSDQYIYPNDLDQTGDSATLLRRMTLTSGTQHSASTGGAPKPSSMGRRASQTARQILKKVALPLGKADLEGSPPSPTSVVHHEITPARDTEPFLPPRHETSDHGQFQRLSLAEGSDRSRGIDDEVRPRKSSLTPVPAHLAETDDDVIVVRKKSFAPVPTHLEDPIPSSAALPPVAGRNKSISMTRKTPTVAFHPTTTVTTFEEERDRRASLAPVPAHLQAPSSSEDSDDSLPPLPLARSITYSVPKKSALRTGKEKRKLSNAIEGLEDMVQEAVEIADVTSDQKQVREVYNIIEDARNSVRKASVSPAQHLMTTAKPLAASESSETVSSTSASRSSSDDSGAANKNKAKTQKSVLTSALQDNQQRGSVALD